LARTSPRVVAVGATERSCVTLSACPAHWSASSWASASPAWLHSAWA